MATKTSAAVTKLTIEIPIEMTAAAIETLGTPRADKSVPVAIARLHEELPPSPSQEALQEKNNISQRAAALCQNPKFAEFVRLRHPNGMTGGDVASYMRGYLGVASRANIATDDVAKEKFLSLEREFDNWLMPS